MYTERILCGAVALKSLLQKLKEWFQQQIKNFLVLPQNSAKLKVGRPCCKWLRNSNQHRNKNRIQKSKVKSYTMMRST